MKRMIAIILAGLLLAGITSCTLPVDRGNDPSTPASSKQEGSESQTGDKGETDGGVLGMVEDPIYRQPLLQIGDYEVTYGVYQHYYYLLAKQMMGEDRDYFKNNPEKIEKLREDTLEQCRITAAYFNLAKQANIELPDEDELNGAFEKFINEYEDLFPLYYGMTMAEYLKSNAMTLSTYKTFYLIDTYLSQPIYEYLSDEKNGLVDLSDDALEKAMEDWRCVKHILVGYNDGLEDAAALKLANELRDRLKAGEDIDVLMKQYSNDYQENGQNAYTFTYDQMVKEFEETAFSMELGAVSDPVKSTYGYHVIVRLPVDKEAFKKDYFLQSAANTAFAKFADEQTVNQLSSIDGLNHEDLMK